MSLCGTFWIVITFFIPFAIGIENFTTFRTTSDEKSTFSNTANSSEKVTYPFQATTRNVTSTTVEQSTSSIGKTPTGAETTFSSTIATPNSTELVTNFSQTSTNFNYTSSLSTSTLPTTFSFDTDWSIAVETTTEAPDLENQDKLPDGCSQSLNLEYGKGIFSASDWSPGSVPNDARLNGRGGWIGGFSDVHYLQVDLEEVFRISGLRLQPHAQWPKNTLKDFRFLYSIDGFHWKKQPSNTDRKINTNFNASNFESLNVFSSILTARYIVIHPISWEGNPGPALRMELYGCRPSAPTESLLVPVVWRGDITADATWGAGSPYLIHQPIKIWPGITLTLAPGVEILFANTLCGFFVEGTLIANGTEELPITLQAYDVMSQLTVGAFWQGITFIPGSTERSSLRYVRISSAGVGIRTLGGLTVMDHLTFERCQCGLRLEGGEQTLPHLLKSAEFYRNDYGLQIYNVSGLINLSNLTFHSSRFVSLSITYPMLLKDGFTDNNIEIDNVHVSNSSYGISISSYQSMKIEISHAVMRDVEYGIYMEFSDAVNSISSVISQSNFVRNSLYAIYIDFKRYARYRWYGDGGNFSVSVENSSFKEGANGLSYFGPESLRGQKSMLSIRKCEFRNLLLSTILQLQEGSSFFISGNKYVENKDRVLDITYNALDVTGIVTENEITLNVPNDEPGQPKAYIKKSLIGIFGVANAQVHGQVSIEYNVITNNKFSRVLDTDLMLTQVAFNVFQNPTALCELCVKLQWIPNGGFINASHNWWGHETLIKSRRRVLDFFSDLDLAAAELTPVLKEPRVRGSSWDLATMHLKQGDDYHNGGIITGSVTLSLTENPLITASIFVPVASKLTLPAGLNLKFSKDIGILVEGELVVAGIADKPVVLETITPDGGWKGIRLLYSKGASFQHTAVVRSRGIQSVGFVPDMNALDVTYSTGPGLWIYVVQPTAIKLSNSYFMYNEDGVYLQIQGNGTNEFVLDVTECHFEENRLNGLKLEAGNIGMNATFSKNTVITKGGFGITLNVSDATINVIENKFNESINNNKTESTFLNIDFDDRCAGLRNVTVIQNSFISTSTPLQGLSIRTSCIKNPSSWIASRNFFINRFDGNPGSSASLLFDTKSNPDPWPLSYAITENSFECVRLQGVAARISAVHGEDVIVYANSFLGCASPIQVSSHFNSHRLAVSSNNIVNSGSTVLHATPPIQIASNGTNRLSASILDFSYNNISRGNGSGTLKTTGYDSEIVMNFFENPASIYDLWVGDLAPVNATLNWWGTDDYNRIVSRVFDGRVDFTRAQATLFPCLLSKNYSDFSTAFPDVFQVLDGVIGGSVKGNITLPAYDGVYEVQYPIRIPYGSSLSIPAGTVLNFRNQTGIYALGHLSLNGTRDKWIQMRPVNGSKWKGITIGKPRHDFMRLRLAGSQSENIGRLEAFVAGSWVGVCADKFDKADAHVACKEVGFTDSTSISAVDAGNLKIGLSNVHCNGLELSLLDCESNVGDSVDCPNKQIATVVCNLENNKRLKRSAEDDSDGIPTLVNFVRIENADIGIQIKDNDGIGIFNIEVVKSRGPGIILNPRIPHGATVIASLVSDGEDIGMDVQGTGPIIITTTNSTRNKAGIDVTSLAPKDYVELSNFGIIDNGMYGMRVNTDGFVNITKCEILRNGDFGVSIKSREMKFNKTLIEDHKKSGGILNSTHGDIYISNTAFVNNGGTDVSVELSTAKSNNATNVKGLVFIRSALVNSTYNTRHGLDYAMHVKINARPEDGRIPIVFSDCRVLDAYSDGVWIRTGPSHANVQVTKCKFEKINGTAVHIETIGISPELNIEENEFNFVRKETVEVEVRS